jgi:hypothetical protein
LIDFGRLGQETIAQRTGEDGGYVKTFIAKDGKEF